MNVWRQQGDCNPPVGKKGKTMTDTNIHLSDKREQARLKKQKQRAALKKGVRARVRKQKQRVEAKADGLVRHQFTIGMGDRDALIALADHVGLTLSDLVCGFLGSALNEHGLLVHQVEEGCLVDTRGCEIDVTMSADLARRVAACPLTSGEVLEIELGRCMGAKWTPQEEFPVGCLPIPEAKPIAMMAPVMAAWRRKNRRWQQTVATAEPYRDEQGQWLKPMPKHDIGADLHKSTLMAETERAKALERGFELEVQPCLVRYVKRRLTTAPVPWAAEEGSDEIDMLVSALDARQVEEDRLDAEVARAAYRPRRKPAVRPADPWEQVYV